MQREVREHQTVREEGRERFHPGSFGPLPGPLGTSERSRGPGGWCSPRFGLEDHSMSVRGCWVGRQRVCHWLEERPCSESSEAGKSLEHVRLRSWWCVPTGRAALPALLVLQRKHPSLGSRRMAAHLSSKPRHPREWQFPKELTPRTFGIIFVD